MPEVTLQIAAEITESGNVGQVKLSGPVQDRMLCYGLLEVAKDIIRGLGSQQVEQNRIIPAVPVALPFRRP